MCKNVAGLASASLLCLELVLGAPAVFAGDAGADVSQGTSQGTNETARPDGQATPTKRIEEIVITGRKREENLLDAPLAVTALTGLDLQDNGFVSLDEVDRLVPNIKFDRTDASSQNSRVFLRGVGQTDPLISGDPGVGIYLDGIYIPRAQGGLLDIVDVERVEVLRGPQGTLYGKNTIGGAINVVTRRPSNEFEASASFRAGNYDTYESRVNLNVPLVPEMAMARFSFGTATSEGYSKNVLQGNRQDDKKLLAGRASFLVTPTDSLEVLLTGERTKRHQAPSGVECLITSSTTLLGLFETGAGGGTVGVGAGNQRAACNASAQSSAFKYRSNQRPNNKLDTMGLSSQVKWELSPEHTLTFLNSWRRVTPRVNLDVDQSENAYVELFERGGDQDSVSHELQWNGETAGGGARWTTGFYYGREIASTSTLTLTAPNLAAVTDQSTDALLEVTNLTYAAFGQLLFDPTDFIHVTLGLRRSADAKELLVNSFRPFSMATLLNVHVTDRFQDWSPMANISVDLTSDVIGYLTYSQGWKSGGFNGRASALGQLEPFDQEELYSWELGVKGTAFDNRVRFTTAAFYNTYKDIQITVFQAAPGGGFISNVRNAGKGRIQGLEAEVLVRPTDRWTFQVVGGMTLAEFLKFNDTDNITMQGIDRSDRNFQDVPPYTLNLIAEYELPMGNAGSLVPRVSWFMQGRIKGDIANTDEFAEGKIGVMDARLAWRMGDEQTEIALWAKNLLNREYLAGGTTFADSLGFVWRVYGPPRTYGIEVTRRFN
jgi:iron complex outermembrane receptor protein